MTLSQVYVGKRYTNIHTGRSCTVSSKIFFNIQFRDDNDPHTPRYCHYKKFRKNWREEGAV